MPTWFVVLTPFLFIATLVVVLFWMMLLMEALYNVPPYSTFTGKRWEDEKREGKEGI